MPEKAFYTLDYFYGVYKPKNEEKHPVNDIYYNIYF